MTRKLDVNTLKKWSLAKFKKLDWVYVDYELGEVIDDGVLGMNCIFYCKELNCKIMIDNNKYANHLLHFILKDELKPEKVLSELKNDLIDYINGLDSNQALLAELKCNLCDMQLLNCECDDL